MLPDTNSFTSTLFVEIVETICSNLLDMNECDEGRKEGRKRKE
jgi:hypothetical protein